jgi:putative transcriptional regulator
VGERKGPEQGAAPPRLAASRAELERWLTASRDVRPEEVLSLRRRLHLTQRELARWLGVSESSVSLWEAGKRRPRGPARRLLALLTGLTPSQGG